MPLANPSSSTAAHSSAHGASEGPLQRLRDDDLLVDVDEDIFAGEAGSSGQSSSSEEGGETSEDVEDDMDRIVAQEDLLRAIEIRLHANHRQLLDLHRFVFEEEPGTAAVCVQRIGETQLEQRLTEMVNRKDQWVLQLSRRRRRSSEGSSDGSGGAPAATGVAAAAAAAVNGVVSSGDETLADSLAVQRILLRPASQELRLKKKELRRGVHRFARLLAKTNEIMWDYISGDDD